MDTKKTGNEVLIFKNIAEKEMLMYQAVIDMVQEDWDINGITVSDITKRAGIGKGTAYEYFSSKEEIIVKALLYDTYIHIKEIETLLSSDKNYSDKFNQILDYLEENIGQTKGIGNLLKLFMGAYDISGSIRTEFNRIHEEIVCPAGYLEKMIDAFMLQGYEEGIYAESNVICRRSVFATQMTGYIYCIFNHYYNGGISREEARTLTYKNTVKLLNP